MTEVGGGCPTFQDTQRLAMCFKKEQGLGPGRAGSSRKERWLGKESAPLTPLLLLDPAMADILTSSPRPLGSGSTKSSQSALYKLLVRKTWAHSGVYHGKDRGGRRMFFGDC